MSINNSLVKAQPKGPVSFSTFLTNDAIKNKVNSMIGGQDGQRFITAIISAVSNNTALAECENSTILSAAMLGESLKLSPSPQLGQYYLVPFNDKKRGCKVAQFQLGYKGYLQLAIRSGYYKKINVTAVRKQEFISYDPFDEEIEIKKDIPDYDREFDEIVGYYAMFEYQNGFRKTLYWSKAKMLKHADQYSAAFSAEIFKKIQDGKIASEDLWKYSSYWYKDFDGMAYKTMIRQLISKWGIMSIEMQKAFENDMGIIKEDGKIEYVENDIIEESPVVAEVVEEKVEEKVVEKPKATTKVALKTESDNVAEIIPDPPAVEITTDEDLEKKAEEIFGPNKK